MKKIIVILTIVLSQAMCAQEKPDPETFYATIPEAPEEFTPGTVVSRMIDGLGFRYYWATEGLREVDLAYRPTAESRTLAQTMDHLYGLSRTIVNSAKQQPTDYTQKQSELSFSAKRNATLENFRIASALFLKSADLSQHKLIFIRPQGSSEFPFWNHINGPIEDAVWHAGQVVVLRRASGNPINPKVNVFLGKLNE
jgi:uncharacterized damage-inducible protein DinB